MKVADLVVIDRPILSVYKNDTSYFITYCVAFNDEYDELLLWRVKRSDLYNFLDGRISLKELIQADNKEFLYLIQTDYEIIDDFEDPDTYLQIEQIDLSDVKPAWLPSGDSMYKFPVPESLKEIFDEASEEDYVELLRSHAVYFKVEPKNKLYLTTVSTSDIASFLKLITNSFMNYVLYDFATRFDDLFTEQSGYINAQEQLRSLLTPRVPYVGYGSFEVALSIDELNPLKQANKEVFEWQKTALASYKKDVIDVDYKSDYEVQSIVDKYPAKVRRSIFNPLFEIANNSSYSVKLSNRSRAFDEKIVPIDKEVRRTITYANDEPIEKEEENLELVT